MVNAQEWLDKNYPNKKVREKIKELDIRGKNLEGELNFSGFSDLEELKCSSNYFTNLNLSKCNKLKKIDCYNNLLTNLDLSNLEQLEILDFNNNYLTKIPYLPNPEKLTNLNISSNNFLRKVLAEFNRFRNLKSLYIGNWNKNKINQGIYNRFYGSLEPLKDLNRLKILDISNTDINKGVECLPESLGWIWYESKDRLDCKLREIKGQLDLFVSKEYKNWERLSFSWKEAGNWINVGVKPTGYNFVIWLLGTKKLDLEWTLNNKEEFEDLRNKYQYFGTCSECNQPNVGQNWCQSCNKKHWQQNKWTSGNIDIDQFIQKHQLETTDAWNVLEWIPYEKFTNIEHIADGGFAKIYKANWTEGTIKEWSIKNNDWKRAGNQEVALKILNSQNTNTNLLQEIAFYKAFINETNNIVSCYGISQHPETKNYVMVMEYIRGDSLREYLKNKAIIYNFTLNINLLIFFRRRNTQ